MTKKQLALKATQASNRETTQTKHRHQMTEGLSHLLADSILLRLKTQNYHWNVTGPQFAALHPMFDSPYQELAKATDLIAERMRALGENAPGSFSALSKLFTLTESEDFPMAELMVHELLMDHQQLSMNAQSLRNVASELRDEGTSEMLTGRILEHDKVAWMLGMLLV